MQISRVNSFGSCIFSAKNSENPVNRQTEKKLAIIETGAQSLAVGLVAGGASSLFSANKKLSACIGVAAALMTYALNAPAKIYNTKVNSFVKEKEMGVFEEQKKAQNGIYDEINKEIKDDEVSLDEKINHYATVKMADNGKGVLLKGN